MHSWMDTYIAHSGLLSYELFKKDVDNTIGVYSHMMKPLAKDALTGGGIIKP